MNDDLYILKFKHHIKLKFINL